MKEIINKVKSPFTDGKIIELLEKYINCNGEFLNFYKNIDCLEFNICENKSNSWNTIVSEKNYLKISNTQEKKNQFYQIYLNLNGQDRDEIIAQYIKKCQEKNKGYRLKYPKKDEKKDKLIIITDAYNIKIDLDIITQLTEDIQLGILPQLIGIYGNGIGITEEYIEAPVYSYLEVRLDMIPKAITKYILDNAIEFIEYCDDKQVKMIEDIRKMFFKRARLLNYDINEFPEDSEQRKIIENEKYAYEQNINLGQIGYGLHIVVVKELIEPLKEYMEENLEKAFPEIITNFRKACKFHGISEKGVFSIETEEIQETSEEIKTLAELQIEFEKLKKQDKRTTQKRDEAKILRDAYKAELAKGNG